MSGVALNIVKGMKPKNYETVEDNKDLRIPVQSEDAFEQGITFKAKYIATQEVPRPASRVEIVSSMRRIRYDYKYRNIKKRKVNIEVSVEGIRVTLWKKRKRLKDSKYNNSQLFIMQYPINRVFYVSHDSQDLLIFSFIARSEDGVFRCSVFKGFKKSQSMNIVRTIGQAFEVCHKLNLQKQEGNEPEGTEDKKPRDAANKIKNAEGETDIDDYEETDIDDLTEPIKINEPIVLERQSSTLVTDLDTLDDYQYKDTPIPLLNGDIGNQRYGPFSLNQLQQLYHQQLQHQMQEAEAARSDVNLLKEQIRIETAARVEAQTRVHKLISQNRELIITVQKLMCQVQDSHAKKNMEAVDETLIISPFPPLTPGLTPASSTATTNFTYPSTNSGTSDFQSPVYDNVCHRPGKRSEDARIGELRNQDYPDLNNILVPDQETLEIDNFVYQRISNPAYRNGSVSRDMHSSSDDSLEIMRSTGHRGSDTNLSTGSTQRSSRSDQKFSLSNNPFVGISSNISEREPVPHSDDPANSHAVDSNIFSKEMLETFSDEFQELSLDRKAKNTVTVVATSVPVSSVNVLETSA